VSFERAEALAFAGRFDAAEAAIARIERSAGPAEGARVRWLRAYLSAARGDFARAERAARALLRSRDLDAVVRARAAATLGSVLRQTGRHADAGVVERHALARGATGEPRTQLLIGLVADSVGLGDLKGVDRALGRVGVRPAGGWRVRVRRAWVRCERELLAGRPGPAAGHARRALDAAERAGARRHVAKSLLFLGAALREAGDDRGADRALRRARAIASRIGARPVAAVAGEMLSRPRARL
jgi:tetratricopeptide (TPR) repeat protein